MSEFTKVWLNMVADTLLRGEVVAPRGKPTREILQRTIEVDMRRPVLIVPNRKLSYVFMLAEAHWILSGDDRVETIAPYNNNIVKFSDDGQVFFGAYGPRIKDQLAGVVNKLLADHTTRQAGINIWRENPPKTKDVPCTVSMFFSIRGGKLVMSVFMRSSDIWLGIPYDVFNFSMLAHLICGFYNNHVSAEDHISPGTLYLTAVSSHLYEENAVKAMACFKDPGDWYLQPETPNLMWQDSHYLMSTLAELKDLPPGSSKRWWTRK